MVVFLKLFKDITINVSSQSRPPLQVTVPAFNNLFDYFEQVVDCDSTHLRIKLAAENALVVMRKYNVKPNDCLLLFIAVCK